MTTRAAGNAKLYVAIAAIILTLVLSIVGALWYLTDFTLKVDRMATQLENTTGKLQEVVVELRGLRAAIEGNITHDELHVFMLTVQAMNPHLELKLPPRNSKH